MTTLDDLKQALDSGAELIDNKNNIIYPPNKLGRYSFNHRRVYWAAVEVMIGNPSDWRIRDQIGAEPTTITVPIDEWNALQEELKKARKIHPFIQQFFSIQNETIDVFLAWIDGLSEADKIFLLDGMLSLRKYVGTPTENTGGVWMAEPIGKGQPELPYEPKPTREPYFRYGDIIFPE